TGDTAIRLAAIWADVLKLDVSDISATASFFAMGGHSLNALVLRNRIYQAFKVQMTLKDLFEHSTLEKAAEYIDNETWLKKDGRQEIATDEEYLFD
ncbi:Phosphopantetheine attachment site, partial [Chitinophaga eiseniae]